MKFKKIAILIILILSFAAYQTFSYETEDDGDEEFSIKKFEIDLLDMRLISGELALGAGASIDIYNNPGFNFYCRLGGYYPIDLYGIKADMRFSLYLSKYFSSNLVYKTFYNYVWRGGYRYRYRVLRKVRETKLELKMLDLGVTYNHLIGDGWSPKFDNYKDITFYTGYRYTTLYKNNLLGFRGVEIYINGLLGISNRDYTSSSDSVGKIVPGFRIGIKWFMFEFNVGAYDGFLMDFIMKIKFDTF